QRGRRNLVVQRVQDVEHRVFEYSLNRGSDRIVPLGQHLIGLSRGSEYLLELRGEHPPQRRRAVIPGHRRAAGPVSEVGQVELESPAAAERDDLRELAFELRRAIRRQPHDLEFVSKAGETQMLRDGEVQETQRVRKESAVDDIQRRADAMGPRRADEVAETVNRT